MIEDEKNLADLLRGYLEREGFEVHQALDGKAGLEAARRTEPDVVVLDWMLPGLDGMEVLREIRRFSEAYVIMLTARTEEVDRIVGLSAGADDYLTKPFSPGELVARVRAMLRRPRGGHGGAVDTPEDNQEEKPLVFGELQIDPNRRRVRFGATEVPLTALEFELLFALASRPGFVFGRRRLLERVWGEDYFGDDHMIDVHIANLTKEVRCGGERRRSPLHPDGARGRLQVRGTVKRKSMSRISRSLGAKLFVSHFLVALVVAFTLLAALYLIAPVIFGRLMQGMMDSGAGMMEPGGRMMQPSEMEGMMGSVGRAFGLTLLYSFLVAGVVAAGIAALSSLFVSRRIANPLKRMSAATRRIAAGRYGERVPVGEPDEAERILSENFNSMAVSLEEVERKRLELIGDVSHELRTPLSNLQGYMEGLMEGVVEPSDETWALLYGEAERMRRLVDDLRRLSQAEAKQLDLHTAAVHPGEMVRIATERMAPLFDEKGVDLTNAVPEDVPRVLADSDRVVQVLTNLLGNALRHTPKGGRVLVETEVRGDSIIFGIEDTGEGIAPEHLPHVFERFYRADKSRSRGEARGGSGLGLAISKALVEAMGGSMRAESSGAGKGAKFSFSLPIADG